MKKRIIFVTVILFVIGIWIYNVGADKRALINVLEYKGYTKCPDEVYRKREIICEGNDIVIIDRKFDIRNNYGESHRIELFKRVDGTVVQEHDFVTLANWNFEERHFDPIDYTA